jgi:hypothetical protein
MPVLCSNFLFPSSGYAYLSSEDRDGRFLQRLVLQHAMCQWVSSSQQQAQCRHLESQTVGEICILLGYYAAYSGSSLPTFQTNLSVPFSKVKKSKIELPLREGADKSFARPTS